MTEKKTELHGTALVAVADSLAEQAHAGVVRSIGMDKGQPYITHPRAVAQALKEKGAREEVLAAALLHDVLEDTPVTVADLAAAGIPQETIDIVVAVTRVPDEPYDDFIERIAAGTPDARAVKLADAEHNLATLTDADGRTLRSRYLKVVFALAEFTDLRVDES